MISENIEKINMKHIVRMTRVAILILLITGSIIGVAVADISIISSSPSSDPTTTVGDSQTFSIDLNEPAGVIWSINNVAVWSETDVLTSSFTDSEDIGIYIISAYVTDGMSADTREWTWTVEPESSQITHTPPKPIITYTTGNFWVNFIVNPDTGPGTNGTDSITVSLDDGATWQSNIDFGTNFNNTVGPHGQSSILAVAYNYSDFGGKSDVASENVQVPNNVPVLDTIGNKIITVDNELTFTVHATDLDGDIITYSKDGAKGHFDSSAGSYSWKPKNGDIGTHTLIISSDDGFGGIDSETIEITVTGEQSTIYVPPTPINLVCTQGNFWIYCTWQPGDGNNTDGYRTDIDGTLNDTTDNSINITTGPHQQKNISIYAKNNSGSGSLSSTPVYEEVQMENNAPIQTGIGDKAVIVGQTLTFTVHATDQDGDNITYSRDGTKGLLNSSTGVYSWLPNSSDVGAHTDSFCSNDNYEGSTCETVTITVSTNGGGNGGNNNNNNGGGSSGGSGGGTSGENYYNIEFKKKEELDIYKDATASYIFANKLSPILSVNITGSSSNLEVTGTIEVLKDRSSLLKISAPGFVYKNINIWIGTSNFATSKNIKFPAIITFRVENSWIDKNSVIRDNIKMVRWDGKKWITLDTTGKAKDKDYTYFDVKTDGFSHFAITDSKNIKGEKYTDIVPTDTTEKPATDKPKGFFDKPKAKNTETTAQNQKKIPGFDIIIGMMTLLMIYTFWRKYK